MRKELEDVILNINLDKWKRFQQGSYSYKNKEA